MAEVDGRRRDGFLEVVDGLGQRGMPKRTDGLIGYIVAPGSAGRGVSSDLARGLLTAAFDHLGLRRVTASCNADNPASAPGAREGGNAA